MEMNGEQIVKRGKKTAKWIIGGYVICILAIIGALFWIKYKTEKQMPEPIDFTTEGAIGLATDQYAYLNVQGLTTEVAIYGDIENEYSSENDRYYIAFNGRYMYIVDLDFDTIDLLKPWQDFTYSTDEETAAPDPVVIYGMTESISSDLKAMILDYYNEGIDEEHQISEADFDNYFGSVLLNVRRDPVDTSWQILIIFTAGCAIFIIAIIHIAMAVEKNRVKKYLKKNEYEEDLVHQLDDFVEEKHYKDRVILTKDFFVDLKYGALAVFKYTDVKWIHIHNVKTYGITASSSLIVYLKDGKTKVGCVEIKGAPTEEFMGILNRICEKAPVDCLKGYTPENRKAFKEYKKELKKRRNSQNKSTI